MSETTTDTSVPRPWHGSDSPFEALHDWMIKELAAIKTAANPTIKALEARIAELESRPVPKPVAMPPVEPPPPAVGAYVPPSTSVVDPVPPTLEPVTETAPPIQTAI